jgi:D-alanyl-D-alanine carboxypeptidase/D-alanyl-D-alanine-endopeptidase (penicillin-binding protein 4)
MPLPRHLRSRALPVLLLAATALGGCAPALGARTAHPSPNAAAIDAIFADTAFAHAEWGVMVRSLDSGATLYRRNAERAFVPASNMKIITGATALEVLGPEYRYRTELLAAGSVQGGVLRGTLVVRGSGDPSIAARFGGDARATFRAWADSLKAKGVRRIEGGIVGIDTVFTDPPLGRGWPWDDLDAYYSAEVSGLEYNDGSLDIRVFPGKTVGSPAIVVLDPPTSYVQLANRVTTAPAGRPARLNVTRDPVGTGVTIEGEVPVDATRVDESVAVRGVSAFFVTALRETLREAGIAVEGPAMTFEEWPQPVPLTRMALLFTHRSPPLSEILPKFLKPSQNQTGEILLRTLGREMRGKGTAAAGAAVVDSLLRARGVQTAQQLQMADGSGLSRYDLVTPEVLIGVLTFMTRSPNWNVWYPALPVAGEDGTLASRFRGTPAAGNVHAKTGTLNGVRSLSGYLTTAGGERLVFSTMVNNHMRSARDADRVIDSMVLRLVDLK